MLDELKRLTDRFDVKGIEYALCGDQAIVYAWPRATLDWESRQRVEWAGGSLSIVSPEGLIALKSLRNSGQDQEDIAYLRSIADEN